MRRVAARLSRSRAPPRSRVAQTKTADPAEIGSATRLENLDRHWQATSKFYCDTRSEIKRRVRPMRAFTMKSSYKKRRRKVIPPILPDPRQARAAVLDRLADQQLQAGFHHQAERLAHRAAEMREGTR